MTTTKHSWRKQRLGTLLAGAVLLAAVSPAWAAPKAPARCGPNGDFGGGIKVSGCAIDACVRKGGLIEIDGGRPYCCVSSGYGEDQVTVCEEVDQLIDLIVAEPTTPPTFQPWSPRPFGAPSRFAR
jgi:hypothetical protein